MKETMTGKIVKGIAGFYYVKVAESVIYVCKAKGLFRKEGIKPLPGDDVEIEVTHEQDMEANIIRILPRRNELIRPAAANVDQALLIFALEDPKPNEAILDRFLIRMEQMELPAVVCFNKTDLADPSLEEKWVAIYRDAGYDTFSCSAKYREGLDTIMDVLRGKTTVIAGPSGVGKSSLINIIAPDAEMETGITSKKLGRGKHTTRHSELFEVCENTYIFDTPGFTSFETAQVEKEDLRMYFPEFTAYEGKCRFNGCVHVNEPGCAVKDAVENGRIHKERYESYCQIFEELKEAEKHKY